MHPAIFTPVRGQGSAPPGRPLADVNQRCADAAFLSIFPTDADLLPSPTHRISVAVLTPGLRHPTFSFTQAASVFGTRVAVKNSPPRQRPVCPHKKSHDSQRLLTPKPSWLNYALMVKQ